jgi:glyoxylase-like metal-dependent hydrolase (beta-lactamase superfamily II)
MVSAPDLVTLTASLRLWQAYDSHVKADLYSTAAETELGIFFIDPIPLKQEGLDSVINTRAIAGVLVTNANHLRAANGFAEKFAAPLFAHSATCKTCELQAARKIADNEKLAPDLHVIEIPGAAAGEIALYHGRDEGTIIMGDALINFEPYGFTFLPPKYCSDTKQMRHSLRRLLDYKFERILFAHGTPLVVSARQRLEQLLGGS